MDTNFTINTTISGLNFDKNINDYNKTFNSSVNKNMNDVSFDEIFNSTVQTGETPLKATIQNTIGLDSINSQKIENLSPTAKLAKDIGSGFSNSLTELSNQNREAEDAIETFASGGDISIHDVMIASQKSSLAMQMAIQLRNQMINTYEEFKNMSI